MAEFVIVQGDDWSGLYVDGKVVAQGHSLRDYEVLAAAKEFGPVTEVSQVEADLDWLHESGWLPIDFSDVKLA